jgi:hypothetical protein
MHKLSTLIYLRTGQYVPIFYILVIRIFVPLFSTVILIIAIVNEFGDIESREKKMWTQGHIWGARMIWLLPIVAMLICMAFPLKDQVSAEELILKQYGIEFNDSEMKLLTKIWSNKCPYDIVDVEVYNTIEFGGMLDSPKLFGEDAP